MNHFHVYSSPVSEFLVHSSDGDSSTWIVHNCYKRSEKGENLRSNFTPVVRGGENFWFIKHLQSSITRNHEIPFHTFSIGERGRLGHSPPQKMTKRAPFWESRRTLIEPRAPCPLLSLSSKEYRLECREFDCARPWSLQWVRSVTALYDL
jgi:hypothetical protein